MARLSGKLAELNEAIDVTCSVVKVLDTGQLSGDDLKLWSAQIGQGIAFWHSRVARGTVYRVLGDTALCVSPVEGHLILVEIRVQQLFVGGVDDGWAVRGCEDVRGSVAAEAAERYWLRAQGDALALAHLP